MTPGMGRDLVSFVVGTLDNLPIMVDIADVIAVDKEGCLGTGRLQVVEQLVGELVGPIVKGQCDCAGDTTRRDDAVFTLVDVLEVGIGIVVHLGQFRSGRLGDQDGGGDGRGLVLDGHGHREQGCCNAC